MLAWAGAVQGPGYWGSGCPAGSFWGGLPCGVACVTVSRIMSVISPLQLEEQVPGEVNKFILTSSKGFSATLGKKGGFGKLEINI